MLLSFFQLKWNYCFIYRKQKCVMWPQISLISLCMPLVIKRYTVTPPLRPNDISNIESEFLSDRILLVIGIYFYTSVKGLNLDVWLGLSWSWKFFLHQVHEPRLAYWMIRGHGQPSSPHWANCHTDKWVPHPLPPYRPISYQAPDMSERALACLAQKNH